MKIKNALVLFLVVVFLSGCTVVRIDTDSIDNTINVVLSKDNVLYNRVGKGYKYYKPRGINYIDTNEYNEKLYSAGNYYYLYVDIISYYYKKEFIYEENPTLYYSRVIDAHGKQGYLQITEQDDLYLVEFMYNYAKIEALVTKEDINNVVMHSSYILSTIKFNSNIIKVVLNDGFLTNKEERYDIFTPKAEIRNYIEYPDENINEEEGLD